MVVSLMPPGAAEQDARRFLLSFMALSVVSGLAIGMGRVVTTFYALSVGANTAQIGLIFAAEAVAKLLVTLPAGFLIFRLGARRVYSTATVGSMLLTLAVPLMKFWYGVALMRALVALCVPFRVVSMNSAFLQRLKDIGSSRAGWYRGAQSTGLLLAAPTLGGLLVAHTNYWVSYGVISACFAFMAVYARTFLPDEDAGKRALADEPPPGPALHEIGRMLRDVRVSEACFIEFVSSATTTLFTTFIIVLAVTVAGLSEQQSVMLLTLQGVATVSCLFVFGPLLRTVQSSAVYLLSVPAMVAALLLLGLCESLLMLSLAAILLSAAASLVHMQNLVEISGTQFSKSKVAGLYNVAGMAGALAGAGAGGAISLYTGLQNLFLLWIVPVLAAVAACVLRRVRRFPDDPNDENLR